MSRGGAALLLAAAWAAAAGGEMSWHRRSLRAASPDGYLAVVALASSGEGTPGAALVCEGEGVELRAEGRRWQVTAAGRQAAQGILPGPCATGFFVKRTAGRLLLGVGGQWVYGREVGATRGKPAVRVGVTGGSRVERFRLVAREPVRFADDFPDPEPKTGLWAPVCGQWVLSSLSFPEQSANPAELAAVFDPLDDVASRGRTRETYVGIGVRLHGGRSPKVLRLAGDSPAARAGIEQGDRIVEIDGVAVGSASEAMRLLAGDEGERVTLTIAHNGRRRKVALTRARVVWGRTRRQVRIEPCTPGDTAVVTTGFDFWTDYRFGCAVQTRGVGAFGLVLAWLGPRDYHLFRWLGADKVSVGCGRWQLVRVRGGQETVLAEREGGFVANDFYAMSVAVEGDVPGSVRAWGAVDGVTVVEASDDALVPGRLGLWAAAPGAVSFDDVVVGDDARQAAPSTANPLQRRDHVMRAWANPAYSWRYVGLGQHWEHKCDFPGDVTLAAPLLSGSNAGITLAAERTVEESGYRFELVAEGRASRLRRAGKVVAEKPLPAQWPTRVEVARRGRSVRVSLDGKPWLSYHDAAPLGGTVVRVNGLLVRDVALECPNVVNYYFNRSPTEWHVAGGHWEVMNRWVCDPRWSFFGGRGDDLLAIWSKRRVEGDCFVDAFVGLMMFERSGRYENMRDVGLSLCGDGRDLASGYSVVVGAEENRVTALLRKGQCVRTTRDRYAMLPGRNRRRGGELYSQHRGWVHIRLAKVGRRVQVYVWDRLVLDYEDPEPLAGGHAAIWSVENGVLLARVRLAADRLSAPRPFLRQARPFADASLSNECFGSQVRVAARGAAYEIANAVGGGAFGVALRPRVFSAVERPRLSFEIKLTPQARVDLYLWCRGRRHRVVLSGPRDGGSYCDTLGAFEGAEADGQWHRVSFDLLAALRKRYPADKLLMVWEPVLANRLNHGYLLAGFGGNGAGATYWLRNVQLERGEGGARLSRR